MTTVDDDHRLLPLSDLPAAAFPTAPYPGVAMYFGAYAAEAAKAAASVDLVALELAAATLLDAYLRDGVVFSCGNGGSAAIANHFQCDHMKGISAHTDLTPRVVSLSANVEVLTAIANDLAYEDVFALQLQLQARPGDVLVAISSSGRSPNIVRALIWARDNGLRTIALTGFDGGDVKAIADVTVHVGAANYGIIEDQHQAIVHALAQFIRQSRMNSETITQSVF